MIDRDKILNQFRLPPILVGTKGSYTKANAVAACGLFHDSFIRIPFKLSRKIHQAWHFIHLSNMAKLPRDEWTKRLRHMIVERSVTGVKPILTVADEVVGEILKDVIKEGWNDVL